MTKKELLESKAFQDAPDDAEIRVGVFDEYEMMSYWGNVNKIEYGKDGRIRLSRKEL